MPRPTYPMSNLPVRVLADSPRWPAMGRITWWPKVAGGAAALTSIAREAGIPEDLPLTDPAEYGRRLKAARTAYYIRLSEARWRRAGSRAP